MYGATELFVPYERAVQSTTPSKTYKRGTVESNQQHAVKPTNKARLNQQHPVNLQTRHG